MSNLIIVRHGQSVWNKENKFTGWVDVDLAEKGLVEAKEAGVLLKSSGYNLDYAFSSKLKRANETLDIILAEMGRSDLHVEKNQALNERMYGDLQGLNKAEVAKEHGEEQVRIWRRSFDIKPPGGESLKDTCERVIPYYIENIKPLLEQGKDVIIAAHGNSLRALVMHLEGMDKESILKFEIPTGKPRLYNMNNDLSIVSVNFI